MRLNIPFLLRIHYWVLCAAALVIAANSLYQFVQTPRTAPPFAEHQTAPKPEDDQLLGFATYLRAVFNGTDAALSPDPAWDDMLAYPLHIDISEDGFLQAEALSLGGSPEQAINQLRSSYQRSQLRRDYTLPDTVSLTLTFFFNHTAHDPLQTNIGELLSGNGYGMVITCKGGLLVIPPHYGAPESAASFNPLSIARAYLGQLGCEMKDFEFAGTHLYRTDVVQWYQPRANAPLQSGDMTVIPAPQPAQHAVTAQKLAALIDANGQWLLDNMAETGALPYQKGAMTVPTKDGSMPRHFIASWALGRYVSRNRQAGARFERNLSFQMKQYYRSEPTAHFAVESPYGPTAANAMALQALNQSPMTQAIYSLQRKALLESLQRSWLDDGQFTTMAYNPQLTQNPARQDRDFAPAAALMTIVRYAPATDVPDAKINRFFDYYYTHSWLRSRSLYGAPWLTLAFGTLYDKERGNTAQLADAIFTMADQLLSCQETDESKPTFGAFTHPACKPVSDWYLVSAMRSEALTTAYRIALKEGKPEHAKRYEKGALDALAYVISGQDISQGGLRISPNDASIRIDGPGHVILAAMLALSTFYPDYR